jgi:hypothetical protein
LSPSHQAHRLVIQHLKVLEDAPTIVDEVEKSIFSAIDQEVERWVQSRLDEWQGVYSSRTGETYFQPKSWGNQDNEEYRFCYQLCWTEPTDTLRHTLSALLGASQHQYGLYFAPDIEKLTRVKGRRKAEAAWKSFLNDAFPETGLADLGFKVADAYPFLPVRVDAVALAEDYPASVHPVLTPALDGLFEALETAHPKIDSLLATAQKHFEALSAISNVAKLEANSQ